MKQTVLLQEKQVAEMIGCSLQTLRNHRHTRKGIPYCKLGRSVRYCLDDVMEYIEERKIRPEEDYD